MKDIRKQQRQEALRRMKKLKLHQNVIDEFEKENKLNMSVINGDLFWLKRDEKSIVKKLIKKQLPLNYLYDLWLKSDFNINSKIIQFLENI